MAKDVLTEWVDLLRPYRHIEDPNDLKVLMSGYWGNLLPGPKIWLIQRGPSGVGGSRNLNVFSKFPDVIFIPEFTHAGFETLLKRIDASHRLAQVEDNPTIALTHLIPTDLTYMIMQEPVVIHDLRLAFSCEFGRQMSGSLYQQEQTFGFLSKGTNLALDKASEWAGELGTRTIEWRLSVPDKPVVRPTDEEDKKAEAQLTYNWMVELAKDKFHVEYKEKAQTWEFPYEHELTEITRFLIRGRSFIDIQGTPERFSDPLDPEHFNRVYEQLRRLIVSYDILSGQEEVQLSTVKAIGMKIALDSIPGWRHKALTALKTNNWEMHPLLLKGALGLDPGSQSGIHQRTFQNIIDHLTYLQMVELIPEHEEDGVTNPPAVRLIKSWRDALGPWTDEHPGGLIDQGERILPPLPARPYDEILAKQWEDAMFPEPPEHIFEPPPPPWEPDSDAIEKQRQDQLPEEPLELKQERIQKEAAEAVEESIRDVLLSPGNVGWKIGRGMSKVTWSPKRSRRKEVRRIRIEEVNDVS